MGTATPAEITDAQPQGSSSSSLILLALAVLIGGACFLYFFLRRRDRMSQFSTPTPATLGPYGPAPGGAMVPATDNGYRFEPSPHVRQSNGDRYDSGPPTDVIVWPRSDDAGMPSSSPLAENVGYWQDVTIPSSSPTQPTPRERPFSPIIELRFVTEGEEVDPPNHDILLPPEHVPVAPRSEADVVELRLS